MRDGKNVYRAPSRSTDTRSAPYVCGALHDVGWKYPGLTKNSRASRYKN
ncbi:integrase, partial [Escherichia coli]|nr:integrase [Escherichia coli]